MAGSGVWRLSGLIGWGSAPVEDGEFAWLAPVFWRLSGLNGRGSAAGSNDEFAW